jgi:23S rRNA pseudouridine1911/1915/1917 synthase
MEEKFDFLVILCYNLLHIKRGDKMVIVDDNDGLRIDSYLSLKLQLSRRKMEKLIKDNKVKVNSKIINNSYRVFIDDEIVIDDSLDYSINILPEDISLDIVYEDDDLLIINKKSGMVVHPAPGHYTGTLVNALLYKYKNLAGDKFRPGIVHRLDKDTSGLMIVAKTSEILEKISLMISKKEVERKYLAIVDGLIKHDTGTIDAPIGRDINDRQKMAVTDKNAKEAITHFKVLDRYKDTTLLECKLETGRTHQIRVHLSYIGYPLVGDQVYGRRKTEDGGQFLHAKTIGFVHPTTNEWMEFDSELPEYFVNFMGNLDEKK